MPVGPRLVREMVARIKKACRGAHSFGSREEEIDVQMHKKKMYEIRERA